MNFSLWNINGYQAFLTFLANTKNMYINFYLFQNLSKAAQDTKFLLRYLQSANIFDEYSAQFFKTLAWGILQDIWESGNNTPISKKGHKRSQRNCRPVSKLSVISKIFQKLWINFYLLCCFTKECSAQQSVKHIMDNSHVFEVVTTFSKVLGYLPHEIMLPSSMVTALDILPEVILTVLDIT